MTNLDETNAVGGDEPGGEVPPEGVSSIHDGLFYLVFSKPHLAAAELKHLLSREFVAMAEWDSLTPLSNKFVDAKLSSKYSDALFSLRVAGCETLIYVLFEHKSESDRWTLLQLTEYLTRIWRTYLADDAEFEHLGLRVASGALRPKPHKGRKFLPIVLPVVVHHSARGWTSPKRFREYFDVPEPIMKVLAPYVLDFGIVLDDLSKASSEVLRARPMPEEAKFTLFCLRYGRTPDAFFANLPDWAAEFAAVRRGHEGRVVTAAIIVYLMGAGKMSEQEVRMRLENSVGTDAADEVMFAWQRRYDKGFREGELKGFRDGELNGERKRLQKLLRHRFGELPPHIMARIQAATAEDLDAMFLRVLTAATLGDVMDAQANESA